MKTIVALGLLGGVAMGQQMAQNVDLDKGLTREQVGHKVVPGGTAPKMQELRPRLAEYHPNAKRTKVRYGPYRLPSVKERTVSITGEPGMMSSMGGMARPCSGECSLLLATANLEFANGTLAENKQGAWLHHVVFFVKGPGRKDTTCPGGGIGSVGERFFSSGNERTPTSFGDVLQTSPKKIKSAYPLTSSDTFAAQLELMNLNTVVKQVYLTVEYDWFKPSAADKKVWKPAKAMWLDITGCGISSKGPPKGKNQFMFSWQWKSTFNGDMLGVGGHLHDGGTVLNVKLNNKVVCASKANYAVGGHSHKKRSTGLLAKRDGPSADGKMHINTMTFCSNMGRMKTGDVVRIEANYDFTKHAPMKKKNGSNAPVMGIAIMYAAKDI